MSTFHPFCRLPAELRIQIWESIPLESRVVNVSLQHRGTCPHKHPLLASSTPVPAVVQVCREARKHAPYQKVFSELASSTGLGLRYIYANLIIDTIDIGTTDFKSFKPVANQIRRLKFEREGQSEYFFHWEGDEIRNFVIVEEIHIVCADGIDAYLDAFEVHYWPCGNENVSFICPTTGEVFRGEEGLDEIADIVFPPEDYS